MADVDYTARRRLAAPSPSRKSGGAGRGSWSGGRGRRCCPARPGATPPAPAARPTQPLLSLQVLQLLDPRVVETHRLPQLLLVALAERGELAPHVGAREVSGLDLVAHVATGVCRGGQRLGQALALVRPQRHGLDHAFDAP